MTGDEFIRKIKKLGRKKSVRVTFVHRRGKGSHGTLFYGSDFTVVQNLKKDLKAGTMHEMLSHLKLKLTDI